MLYWACLSFGAQWMGLRMAPIFKPHQLPPSPCVRTAWARAVIVPASIAISTCLFGLTLIAAISRVLIITLWVSRLSFLFLTTSSVSRSSGLLAFFWISVCLFGVGSFSGVFLFLSHSWARHVSISSCFLDWYDEVLGFSRLYLVYTVRYCDGLESLFIFAYRR